MLIPTFYPKDGTRVSYYPAVVVEKDDEFGDEDEAAWKIRVHS